MEVYLCSSPDMFQCHKKLWLVSSSTPWQLYNNWRWKGVTQFKSQSIIKLTARLREQLSIGMVSYKKHLSTQHTLSVCIISDIDAQMDGWRTSRESMSHPARRELHLFVYCRPVRYDMVSFPLFGTVCWRSIWTPCRLWAQDCSIWYR